jgi:hypothetical protein
VLGGKNGSKSAVLVLCKATGQAPLTLFGQSLAELRRIPILGNSVNKALLVCLLTLRGRLGAQPQRDVGRLHRLPYHVYQFVVQRLQVRLVP